MYDAFISYRRDNGFYIARLVRDQLEKREISAFLDLEELRSGEFNKKLYEAIGNSRNFILILSPGALDRCVYEDDWVRKEILAAVELKRNIIPVLGENFEWPRALYSKFPEEICALEHFSGVNTSKDYFWFGFGLLKCTKPKSRGHFGYDVFSLCENTSWFACKRN